MSCNSQQLRPGILNGKTNKMVPSFLLLLLFKLATVLSASTGYYGQDNGRLPLIGNSPMTYGPTQTPLTGINKPEAAALARSTLVRPLLTANSRPVIRRDPYVSDTCGGTVNLPLSFDRLLPYKSTHFPSRRDYPMLCVWNFTVQHDNCRRAHLTMRVDGRSRLPDADACRKGYYTVSPNMRGARICGHVGDVPAYQWYVDNHLHPGNEVTVVTMKNLGINDGFSEGLSFTLQGECAEDEWANSMGSRTNADKENVRLNRRWMTRVAEDHLIGEGPRVVFKRPKLPSTITSTSTPSPTTSSRPDHPVVNKNSDPWFNLKSPGSDLAQEIHQKSANSKFQPPQVVTTTETNQPSYPAVDASTISSHLEYPATTTTPSVPALESTIEPEEEEEEENKSSTGSTWPATTTDPSTDLLTTSTPLEDDTTSSTVTQIHDELLLSTTLSAIDDPLTTPSSTTEIPSSTTILMTTESSGPLSDLLVVESTQQQPPIISHVVAHNNVTPSIISGHQLVLNKFKTFQRRFLKFLKLFTFELFL